MSKITESDPKQETQEHIITDKTAVIYSRCLWLKFLYSVTIYFHKKQHSIKIKIRWERERAVPFSEPRIGLSEEHVPQIK